MKKLISAFIIIVILVITTYLIFKIPQARSSQNPNTEEPKIIQGSSEEWLGMFLQGQRVGYSFTKITKTDQGLVVENRSQMTIFMMQEVQSLTTHFFAHTDKDYTLKDFSMEIKTAGHPTKIEGKIAGTALTLTSYSQGIPETKTITLKEKPYFPDALEEVIKEKNLKPGDEIIIPYFDPTTQSPAPAKIKVFAPEPVRIFDKELTGKKVQVDFMGITSFLWFDDNYKLIKESSPNLGLEMIPLSKEEALAEIKPGEAFDLLSFFAVKLDKPIANSKELSFIKLALRDITTEELDLQDDYQKLVSEKPLILESFSPDFNILPNLAIPIQEQKEYLESSVYIQCAHPEIIAEAKRIVGDEKDAKKAVEKLVSGVYQLLEKKPTPSLPSALDVLKTKEGDCNEHSILFTALARALGIPTKIYVGLVNLSGDAYWYHAWCAVWLGRWVPVDPTFNQCPANLYHLKLKEGEISEQAKVLNVVGKLKIDVLEYK